MRRGKNILALLLLPLIICLNLPSTAQAGNNAIVDLNSTLTNLKNSYPSVTLKVSRIEEPSTNSYQYRLSYIGLNSSKSQCSLILNNVSIQNDECQWFGFGGSPLNSEGIYVLSIDGVKALSFTFHKLKDNPAPLGKAICLIKSLSISKATGNGTWLTITSNGKCQDGLWSIAFQAGKENSGSGNITLNKGRYFIPGLNTTVMNSKVTPVVINVYYTPNAHIAGSKRNLVLR